MMVVVVKMVMMVFMIGVKHESVRRREGHG